MCHTDGDGNSDWAVEWTGDGWSGGWTEKDDTDDWEHEWTGGEADEVFEEHITELYDIWNTDGADMLVDTDVETEPVYETVEEGWWIFSREVEQLVGHRVTRLTREIKIISGTGSVEMTVEIENPDGQVYPFEAQAINAAW